MTSSSIGEVERESKTEREGGERALLNSVLFLPYSYSYFKFFYLNIMHAKDKIKSNMIGRTVLFTL